MTKISRFIQQVYLDQGERLKKARKTAGFKNANAAANATGIDYRKLKRHEDGQNTFDAEISNYASAFGVSEEWLYHGVDAFELDKGPGQSLIPVYDIAASAGHGAIVDYEPVLSSLALPHDFLTAITSTSPKQLAIISVKGESMEPTLLNDDVVLVDTSKQSLSFDGLFVLRFDEALHVKRVGRSADSAKVMVISDNASLYPVMEVDKSALSVVGKVLWYGRKV